MSEAHFVTLAILFSALVLVACVGVGFVAGAEAREKLRKRIEEDPMWRRIWDDLSKASKEECRSFFETYRMLPPAVAAYEAWSVNAKTGSVRRVGTPR